MLIAAVQVMVTTIVFANMLLTLATSLKSFVKLFKIGAMAMIGTALMADAMLRPPAPHFGNTVAMIPSKYPKIEPKNKPPTATMTVAFMFSMIVGPLSNMILKILPGRGSAKVSAPSNLCKSWVCQRINKRIPNMTGYKTVVADCLSHLRYRFFFMFSPSTFSSFSYMERLPAPVKP
jgi:hypothetical protein